MKKSGFGAGSYSTAFTWQVRTLGDPSTEGEKLDVHTGNGTLWGRYEIEPDANSAEFLNSENQDSTATIALRNYPAIGLRDRLVEPGDDGRSWEVESFHFGDNETLCQVTEV